MKNPFERRTVRPAVDPEPDMEISVSDQEEEQRRTGKPHPRRAFLQQRVQKAGQQHGGGVEMQHTEPDGFRRHEPDGDHRKHHRAPGHQQAVFPGLSGQRKAVARQQDKAPADILLPHMTPRRPDIIPAARMPEYIHPVVQCMVGQHIHQRGPAQHIQQPQAFCGHSSPALSEILQFIHCSTADLRLQSKAFCGKI